MMLGLRDYVVKNRFPGVVLGMSGGIDSALTAAVAVDALGHERVRGVRLPSQFTSRKSLDDAAESARLLGMRLDTIEIGSTVAAAESSLADAFRGRARDVTEENLQARVRGLLLMGLSNKFGEMLVTTGNKSEMSVGYATLYGDAAATPCSRTYTRRRSTNSRDGATRTCREALWAQGARDSGIIHHQGADRGVAPEPDRSGLVATL